MLTVVLMAVAATAFAAAVHTYLRHSVDRGTIDTLHQTVLVYRDREDERTRCQHPSPVPVESTVTGEVLAHLCPACNAQLPASFEVSAC